MSPRLVYVADDDVDLRELYVEALQSAGHDVSAYPDGEALLAAVGQKQPDLILLDINMPGITGWQVQARLQDSPQTSAIPVIAITAQGGASVQSSALTTLRFAAYIRKPFRLAGFLQQVEAILAQTEARPHGA